MKKAIRTAVVACSLGMVFLSISATESRAQGVLREILDRMDKYNKAITSLQADVTMVKSDSTLKIDETSSGTATYISKNAPKAKGQMYARINWVKPAEEQIIVIGDSYELYRPRLNQVIYGKAQQAKNSAGGASSALAFMNMSRDQLKANYDVAYIGQEDMSGTKVWHLELTPTTKASYKQAELWIDANGAPLQAKITERNNDTTTIRLTARKENPKLDTSLFIPKYPSGVKRIAG
ncbi:MAG: LolA family protein [Pyrinomonadaceae bacterium]